MEGLKKSFLVKGNSIVGAVGDKYFSTCPLGTVLSYAGNIIPRGFLVCNGASYKVADYPDLYAVIGNTYGGDTENFNVPDYRETVLVGVGENTTDTIADHDVYELGEFKDDQLQSHLHDISRSANGSAPYFFQNNGSGSAYHGALTTTTTGQDATSIVTGVPACRRGSTTHGKQKGVTYIIKAFHTNEGVDSGVSDDVINYVNDSLVDKQDFRIFKSLEEFNEKKGTSFTVVSGVDNMVDIANAMSEGDMLIITTKYNTGSEIYFGLDSSTGWTKIFTFIKANGLCDVECRTTSPSTFKRVLNMDGVIGAWQEIATMDKIVPSTRLESGFKVVAYSDRTITGNSKLECLENWVTNALSKYNKNLCIIGSIYNINYVDGFAIVKVWGDDTKGILGASGILVDQDGIHYYKKINGASGSGTLTKIN